MLRPYDVVPAEHLSVRGVSARFGGLSVLDDVSFEVPPRSVVGLIGPNGAGKTTLFNVVCGFVRPVGGTVTWRGRPLHTSPHRLVHQGISRTLQAVGLFPHLTALDNVMVGAASTRRDGFTASMFGLPRAVREERRLRAEAHRWLERLDIGHEADRPASTLPYPVQKRVALARALISRPSLLLLDEPAGGLGEDDLAQLAELVRALPEDDEAPCSVLLVEHHLGFVMSVCDQVVVLDFGRRVAVGTPEQVQADPLVATVYLGAEEETR